MAGIAAKETFNTPISQVVPLVFFGVNAKDDKWYLSKYFRIKNNSWPHTKLALKLVPLS